MKYNLDVNGRPAGVEIGFRSENQARVGINKVMYDLKFQRISEHEMLLDVDGRQVNVWMENTDKGKRVILNGRQFFILDKDALEQSGKGSSPKLDRQPRAVTPPMPAIVIQVVVSTGDRVKKGDIVVVVSAMKMETALKAPYDGIITRLEVVKGDKVMPGDILADIEKFTD